MIIKMVCSADMPITRPPTLLRKIWSAGLESRRFYIFVVIATPRIFWSPTWTRFGSWKFVWPFSILARPCQFLWFRLLASSGRTMSGTDKSPFAQECMSTKATRNWNCIVTYGSTLLLGCLLPFLYFDSWLLRDALLGVKCLMSNNTASFNDIYTIAVETLGWFFAQCNIDDWPSSERFVYSWALIVFLSTCLPWRRTNTGSLVWISARELSRRKFSSSWVQMRRYDHLHTRCVNVSSLL